MSAAEVRAYGAKAQEFAEAAESELQAKRYVAATSLAIHAAINASDVVCGRRLGQRAAGEDHDQVVTLLKQAGAEGAKIARDLRRLLPLKSKAEYDPTDVAQGDATRSVERARRCVAIALAVASEAK